MWRWGRGFGLALVLLFGGGAGGQEEAAIRELYAELQAEFEAQDTTLLSLYYAAEFRSVLRQDLNLFQEQLEKALPTPVSKALILRTLPNPGDKKHKDYTGTNPPFLEPKGVAWLRDQGVEHLLLDLPSVDPEQDGGSLAAHKAFWGLPGKPRPEATITEFIFVPDYLKDGRYLLNLQVAVFDNDACPSRPLLFPLVKIEQQ